MRSRTFFSIAYPDLQQRNAWFNVTTGDLPLSSAPPRIERSLFVFRVAEDRIGLTDGVRATRRHEILALEVKLTNEGRLVEARAVGEFIHTDRVAAARRLVDERPTWKDEDVYRHLRTQGARFTPDQVRDPNTAFGDRIRELQSFLGAVSITSVEFTTRDGAPGTKSQPTADLTWSVIVETTPREIKPNCYTFIFEPFDGRLMWLFSETC